MPKTPQIQETFILHQIKELIDRAIAEHGLPVQRPRLAAIMRYLDEDVNEEAKCEVCSGYFKRTRSWQRFCSRAHRQEYHRVRQASIRQEVGQGT